MEGGAVIDLMIVVSQSGGSIDQEGFEAFLPVDRRQRHEGLAVQVEQVEGEEDQRGVAMLVRVLDQVEGCPAIREHTAEFAVEVGGVRRERRQGLGQRGVLVRPVVAASRQDFHPAGVDRACMR